MLCWNLTNEQAWRLIGLGIPKLTRLNYCRDQEKQLEKWV
jgi:hypothetical protein